MNEQYYTDEVAATYDVTSPGIPGDVDFYLELARQAHEAGQPVLELACGTGRVAVPIARAGISIVGLDAAPTMLAIAREKGAALDTVRWVEGDMRSFALPERFGFAFIAYRSFQHLLTIEDELACLRCVHDHLVPGGRFSLSLFNPNIVDMGLWLSSRRGSLQRMEDYQHPGSGRRALRWEERRYRQAQQESQSTRVHEELDDQDTVISRTYRFLKLRYLFRYEAEHLLARAGFEIEALYGDFLGAEFTDTSPEMVWVARRA
ncbi:MAG: class I SAM-dependent methyltransferase [Dehalococcoidia bacterium]